MRSKETLNLLAPGCLAAAAVFVVALIGLGGVFAYRLREADLRAYAGTTLRDLESELRKSLPRLAADEVTSECLERLAGQYQISRNLHGSHVWIREVKDSFVLFPGTLPEQGLAEETDTVLRSTFPTDKTFERSAGLKKRLFFRRVLKVGMLGEKSTSAKEEGPGR